MREWEESAVPIVIPCLTPCAVFADVSNVVDIFNATSRTWSTAALSEARSYLVATSLPNAGLAIFAGGVQSTFLLRFFELLRDALLCEGGCASGRRVLCLS